MLEDIEYSLELLDSSISEGQLVYSKERGFKYPLFLCTLEKQLRIKHILIFFSLMKLVDFCASANLTTAKHIAEVPNKHNRICNSKSSWEVMLEHDDFKGL